MSTAPYSIFDALSKLPFSPAPATDLVHYLIRSLAQEACEQHEVFGIQTYYRIVSRARDICHRINEYIVDVAVDHKDWEKYHKYTAQIAPLESLLFQVSQLIHEETHRKHEHRENALQLYIERFEHWKCHREIYRNILIKLHSAPFDACDYDWELDFKAACDHDDRAWLSIICEKILISLNIFAEKFQRHIMRFSHITAVIKLLAEIQIILEESETFDETRIICVTRCFMTIWGMIQVACDPHIDWAVSRHLRSRKTWTRILEWVERFKIAVCDFSVEIEILVEELTIIVEYVVHAHTEPQDVDELLQFLICHPAKVRRPYYAQSLALVRLCENIGGHIKTTHHGADIGKLEWAVELSIVAMEQAEHAAAHTHKYDWDVLISNDAAKAFKEAFDYILETYGIFQMNVQGSEKLVRKAQSQDKEYVHQLCEHIGRLEALHKPLDADGCICGDSVSVKLNIHKHDGDAEDSIIHTMKSGGGLESILWKLTRPGAHNQHSVLAGRPRFYRGDISSHDHEVVRHTRVESEMEISVVQTTTTRSYKSSLMSIFS